MTPGRFLGAGILAVFAYAYAGMLAGYWIGGMIL